MVLCPHRRGQEEPCFDFLPAGQPFAPVGSVPITHATISPGVRTTSDYDWDPTTSTWKRTSNGTPQVTASGVQIAPNNVIFWFVPYVNSPGDVDVVGEPVTAAQVIGTGEAWVLSQGKLVTIPLLTDFIKNQGWA